MKEQHTRTASARIDWHSLLRDLVRNFSMIILAACIAWMGIYIYSHTFYAPKYASNALLAVRAQLGTSGAYADLNTTTGMAKVYCEIFRQPSTRRLASEYLGQTAFDGSLSATMQGETNIINLMVVSDDPEKSFRLLHAVLEVYPEVADGVFPNSVVSLLQAPEMAAKPINPLENAGQMRIVAVAALLEAALILCLSYFRGTVKNEQMFKEMIDGVLLGTVTHEAPHLSLFERFKRKKCALLIDDAYTSLRFSEDYQRLANKLEYVHAQNGAKIFTVTSVVENEGKSTVAVNLALALSARGLRVALLDLDVRRPAVHKIFDIKHTVKTDFSAVLSGEVPMENFKFFRYRRRSLYLALNRNSRTDLGDWLSGEQAHRCLEMVRQSVDFVIIDSSPIAVSADAVHLTEISDATLLVVRTDVCEAEDINDAILTIQGVGGTLLGCILNDLPKSFTLFGQIGVDENGYYYDQYVKRGTASDYSKLFETDISGIDDMAEPMGLSVTSGQESDDHA